MSRGVHVAVTGAAGSVDARLVERLTGSDGVDAIVAFVVLLLNASQPKVATIRWNIREPVADILRVHGVDSVVRLAFLPRPGHDGRAVRRVHGKVFAPQLGNAGAAGKANTATQALQENPAAARNRRQANHGLPALRDNPGALFLRHASSHASGPPHLGNRHVALDQQRPADRPTIPIRHGVRPPESARKRKSAPNPRVLEGCGSRTGRSSIKMCKKHDKDQKATQSIQ